MLNRLVAPVALMAVCFAGFAQGHLDVVSTGYGFGAGGDYSSFDRLNLDLKVPVPLNADRNDILLIGTSISISTAEGEHPLQFYEMANLTFNPALIHTFKNDKSMTLMLFNRWNGRQISFKNGHYQLGGLAMMEIWTTDNHTSKIGFYGNDEFFGVFVTPFYGIDWKINDRLRLSGNIPVEFTMKYDVGKKFATGLYYFGLVSSFKQSSTYIERQVLNLGPFLEYSFTKSTVLKAHVGYLLGSSLKEYALGDKAGWTLNIIRFNDDRTLLRSIDVTGMFLSFTLAYRIATE